VNVCCCSTLFAGDICVLFSVPGCSFISSSCSERWSIS